MSVDSRHVCVLLGGLSAEREVSLRSGAACAAALRDEGFRVTELDAGRDVAARLAELRPDVAFNALHGPYGEDGCIQGILETLGIPYTHSGVLASSLAMHKERAKTVMAAAGIPVAAAIEFDRAGYSGHPMPPPYVIKPVADGSSFGVIIVAAGDPAPQPDTLPRGPLMAERYIPGRELTCAALGDRALGVIEIVPAEGMPFYDYQAKYAAGGSVHILPAQISPNLYALVQKLTVAAHRVLGCRGVSRADFRLDDAREPGELICLEVNTQPGMTATSLVPELAAHAGMSFGQLARWLVNDASVDR